jgi:hypothetical protein
MVVQNPQSNMLALQFAIQTHTASNALPNCSPNDILATAALYSAFLLNGGVYAQPPASTAEVAPAAKPSTRSASKPATQTKEVINKPAPVVAPEAPAVDRSMVETAIVDLINSGHRTAVAKIFTKYNATKLSEIKAGDFAAVYTEATTTLESLG